MSTAPPAALIQKRLKFDVTPRAYREKRACNAILFDVTPRAYREKRACNAILFVKTSKSLLLLRIAFSVINYCYGIRRVNGN